MKTKAGAEALIAFGAAAAAGFGQAVHEAAKQACPRCDGTGTIATVLWTLKCPECKGSGQRTEKP